jgi:hypothetical protein
MRNNIFNAALVLALLTTPAAAQTAGYDPPTKMVNIPPSGLPGSGDGVTCTYYGDVMIRVSGTDTPAPDNALILPSSSRCGRSAPSHGMELQSGASDLAGRKGNFLVFGLSDPTGATAFTVFNVQNGRQLFQDGLLGYHGMSIKMSGDILYMRYLRGVNTTCSLLSDRDGCWSQLLANGVVPRGAFSGPPSLETCKKSYDSDPVDQRSPNPDNDPSIISYEVALTLDSKGNAIVKPVGALRCDPMP